MLAQVTVQTTVYEREVEDTKGIFKLVSWKQTDDAMAKNRKLSKDKQQNTKHSLENKSLSNRNPTYNQGRHIFYFLHLHFLEANKSCTSLDMY